MNIKPYNVRRLFLEHEVNSIFALHASAKEFQSHYPNYDAWLNKSLREVLQGKRVAFGLFLSGFDDTLKHNSTMVGSVILKPDSYARTTELKNIYIAENHRNSSYGTALLEKVCSYCSEVASTVLETEVPCDLTKTVGFFHKNGFHVNSMRRSPYVQTQYQYRMEKLFPPCYSGDPFDIQAITKWVLESYYSFNSIKHSEHGFSFIIESGLHELAFLRSTSLNLRGRAEYGQTLDTMQHLIDEAESDSEMTLVFCEKASNEQIELLASRGIRVFTWSSLTTALKRSFSVPPPAFEREGAKGLVVPINADVTTRLLSKRPTNLPYIKTGTLGYSVPAGSLIIFLSEPSPANPFGNVICYGRIDGTFSGSPDSVWNEAKELDPVFSIEEFHIFAAYHREMLLLKTSNLVYVDKQKNVSKDDLGKLLEDSISPGRSTYIHQDIVSKVRSLIDCDQIASSTNTSTTLKISYLSSNPSETTKLKLGKESRVIRDAIAGLPHRPDIQLEDRFAVTFDELQRCLLEFQPTVVHFGGHGYCKGITLETDDGDELNVSIASLKQFFQGFNHSVKLIIFNSCYTADEADELLSAIPNVIAVIDPLSDKDAIHFVESFYRAVAYDRSLEECFNMALSSVEIQGDQSKYMLFTKDESSKCCSVFCL